MDAIAGDMEKGLSHDADDGEGDDNVQLSNQDIPNAGDILSPTPETIRIPPSLALRSCLVAYLIGLLLPCV
jgi:hypothetical protein